MRKLVFGISVVAVFAFSVVAASAAFAEEALWLVNGAEPAAGVHVPTTITGLLFLTDLKAPGMPLIHCEGAFDGWVGANGEDEIEQVLQNNELLPGAVEGQDLIECEVVVGSEGPCETSMLADVETVGLPWMTLLELVGTAFVDDITSLNGEKVVGYMVTCLTIIGEVLDTCTTALASATIDTGAETLTGLFNEIGTGNCSLGGAEAGDVEGEGLFTSTSGTLTVDSP